MEVAETKNEQELTSNTGNSVLSTTTKTEKTETGDSTPTSSTDAYTNNDDSVTVSDDPISSTSNEFKENLTPKSTASPSTPKPEQSKMSVIDTDADLLGMESMPSEKITEDVEDLVRDLESLLGEPTESFNLPNVKKKEVANAQEKPVAEVSDSLNVESVEKREEVAHVENDQCKLIAESAKYSEPSNSSPSNTPPPKINAEPDSQEDRLNKLEKACPPGQHLVAVDSGGPEVMDIPEKDMVDDEVKPHLEGGTSHDGGLEGTKNKSEQNLEINKNKTEFNFNKSEINELVQNISDCFSKEDSTHASVGAEIKKLEKELKVEQSEIESLEKQNTLGHSPDDKQHKNEHDVKSEQVVTSDHEVKPDHGVVKAEQNVTPDHEVKPDHDVVKPEQVVTSGHEVKPDHDVVKPEQVVTSDHEVKPEHSVVKPEQVVTSDHEVKPEHGVKPDQNVTSPKSEAAQDVKTDDSAKVVVDEEEILDLETTTCTTKRRVEVQFCFEKKHKEVLHLPNPVIKLGGTLGNVTEEIGERNTTPAPMSKEEKKSISEMETDVAKSEELKIAIGKDTNINEVSSDLNNVEKITTESHNFAEELHKFEILDSLTSVDTEPTFEIERVETITKMDSCSDVGGSCATQSTVTESVEPAVIAAIAVQEVQDLTASEFAGVIKKQSCPEEDSTTSVEDATNEKETDKQEESTEQKETTQPEETKGQEETTREERQTATIDKTIKADEENDAQENTEDCTEVAEECSDETTVEETKTTEEDILMIEEMETEETQETEEATTVEEECVETEPADVECLPEDSTETSTVNNSKIEEVSVQQIEVKTEETKANQTDEAVAKDRKIRSVFDTPNSSEASSPLVTESNDSAGTENVEEVKVVECNIPAAVAEETKRMIETVAEEPKLVIETMAEEPKPVIEKRNVKVEENPTTSQLETIRAVESLVNMRENEEEFVESKEVEQEAVKQPSVIQAIVDNEKTAFSDDVNEEPELSEVVDEMADTSVGANENAALSEEANENTVILDVANENAAESDVTSDNIAVRGVDNKNAGLTDGTNENAALSDMSKENPAQYEEANENSDISDVPNENADISDVPNENADIYDTVNENADISDTINENVDISDTVNENVDISDTVNENAAKADTANENADVSDTVNENADVSDTANENADVYDTVNENADISDTVNENADISDTVNENSALPDTSGVDDEEPDYIDDETQILTEAANAAKRNQEIARLQQPALEKPLTINVDEIKEAKVYSPKLTIKPLKVPDEEISTTSSVETENREPLKMTITKQSDKMHSILKIYNPNDPEQQQQAEDGTVEQLVPKLIIKKDQQQPSPKMSTRSKSSYSSPTSSTTPRSGSPRVTSKAETVSPLKITIKTPIKNEEIKQKHSPKLIIKPVIKPDEETKEEKSPKLHIKPIKDEPEQKQVHSPKIRIKPIPKPEEAPESPHPLRVKIKPVKGEIEHTPKSSPKLIIKPVVKPAHEENNQEVEEVKEPIVLKINKGNLATPTKEGRKRDHSEENHEKLKKIKLKFSKEGGHPHIVHQHREEEVVEKRGSEEDPRDNPKKLRTEEHNNPDENVRENEAEAPPRVEPSEMVDRASLEQTPQLLTQPPFQALDTPPSILITQLTPTPRKRGRPRKIPIEQRVELQKEEPAPIAEGQNPEDSPASTSTDSGRPKRSCRGQSARVALGIKPRKPRGAGRSRGTARGGLDTRTIPMKPEKEVKLSKARLKLLEKSAKELLNQKTTDESIGPLSEFSNFRVPAASGEVEATSSNEVSSSQVTEEVTDTPVSTSNVEGKLNVSSTEIAMFEEETRMSADSRAQTPAKHVVVATPMEVEESQSSIQSTATIESGKTPISKPAKGSRLEVHQDLDQNIISADQLAEYHWNGNGPFMLQEQVAQFLGIKSFKRKYPNVQRRAVDMQERDFIRDNGLASEAMCDMGLTAVSCADILDIMYSDFQDKYEEYCKHQRDRQTKELINKHKAMTLAATQEKNKQDMTNQAVHSAANWNANFNKTRREQRKASMDLQTWTVHYPKNKVKQLTRGKIGHYPVALVPGQFTDFYQEYTPTEINNLPINTMCYDPINIPQSDESDSSSSDSESESSSGSSSSGSCSGDEDCKMCIKQQQVSKKVSASK